MASQPAIHIVCSGQHRNGKTLLARLLADYLLLEDRDPFLIDLSHPEGALRSYFPGRTALVDFSDIRGQMLAFDTMLQAPGRDYVVDVPVQQLPAFVQVVHDLNVIAEAAKAGLATVVFCIVDQGEDSLKAAASLERVFAPALFVPVRNLFVGSALSARFGGLTLVLPVLDPELRDLAGSRRFSFRNFVLGEEAEIPFRLRPQLRSFLQSVMAGLAEVQPALSLARLRV